MKNKLILPISIILGAIILGGFYYFVQINEQESIERQQSEKVEVEKKDMNFVKDLECQKLLPEIEKKYNNIVGIRYSDFTNSCMVKYKIENGNILEKSIEYLGADQ